MSCTSYTLKFFISDVFWILETISQFLFVKHFYFSLSYNIFFYTLYIFFIFRESFISFTHILSLFFSLLFLGKSVIFFTRHILWSLFFVLVIFSWWIFRHFYICEKKYSWKQFIVKTLTEDLKMLIYIIHKFLIFLQAT